MKQIRDYYRGLCLAAFPAVALLAAHQVEAQTQPRLQSTPRLTFEVASLKERDPKKPLGILGIQVQPGRLVAGCASLNTLLFYAYRLTLATPVTGAPVWADTPCNDAIGTDTYEVQATMPPGTTDAQTREMMQSLLAQRFRLAVHWETKSLPVYSLIISSGGFKLKPSDPKDAPPRAPGSIAGCPPEDRNCRVLPLGPSPISALTLFLALYVGRPVIDKTGRAGTYDMELRWAGDDSPTSPLPSLPGALKEQFGLELKSDSGPVDVLVIDRVEKPSPN